MDRQDSSFTVGCMPMPAGFPYRSIFLRGRPHHEKYDDFWRRHPPMDTLRRARIFAPFDALAGFDECIADKEVIYSGRRDLSEGEKEELDRKLAILHCLTRDGREARKNRPQITVQYFTPCTDENSSAFGSGGTCRTVTGICTKVDAVFRTLTVDETVLPMEDIISITGSLFEALE